MVAEVPRESQHGQDGGSSSLRGGRADWGDRKSKPTEIVPKQRWPGKAWEAEQQQQQQPEYGRREGEMAAAEICTGQSDGSASVSVQSVRLAAGFGLGCMPACGLGVPMW